MKKIDVIITDSELKHSLATVRALGKEKLKVATCSEKFSATKLSRYSKYSFKYNKNNLITKVLENAGEDKTSTLIPIGYNSNILCSKNKKILMKKFNMLIADYDKITLASDKEKINSILDKIKFPKPKTWIIKSMGDIKKVDFNGPMIIKSSQEMRGKKVEYLNNLEELKQKAKERLNYGTQIVQERVRGFGCGFFALCKKGKVKVSFQHRRIREYPYSGGVSSCAESYYDPKLESLGKKIVKALNWEGICMIEFICEDKTKNYKLIEMNAKFWGSLDLAIASGINFPYLLYLEANNKPYTIPKYKTGVRFQWILPEDTLRIKTSPKKLGAIKEYLTDLFSFKVKKDIGYIFIDPLPTLLRIGATFIKLFKWNLN